MENDKKKKDQGILICPNPVAMANGGLSATPTSPMPPAIHGGIAEESIKKESTIDYPVSEGLCPEVWD